MRLFGFELLECEPDALKKKYTAVRHITVKQIGIPSVVIVETSKKLRKDKHGYFRFI